MRRSLLIDELEEYCDKMIPMHMPGHKRNTDISKKFRYLKRLGADLDITEVEGFDDLHEAEGILKESMERAALFWGSDRVQYLVNGSSCGILAGIYALTDHGDKVIAARNCHKSVYHAIELRGLDPIFVLPPEDEETGILGSIDPKDVEEALNQHPDAKLIILTSPTYEGVISDIEGICKIAHRRGIPVFVDEAHGSHLGHYGIFPSSAVKCGADLVVQSLHKTLPGLTQTALIHINEKRIDVDSVKRAVSIFETSSPSYLLLSSIDSCTAFLEEEGEEAFRQWKERLSEFDEKVSNLKSLYLFSRNGKKNPSVFDYDESKLVICTGSLGKSGREVSDILRKEYSIETELSSLNHCIAMTGMGDRRSDMESLAEALIQIDNRERKADVCRKGQKLYSVPAKNCSVSKALSLNSHIVTYEEAEGRVSAEYIWAYPPGIPLIVPGEIVGGELIELFRSYKAAGISLRSTGKHSSDKICVVRA